MQRAGEVVIRTTRVLEYLDDEVTEEALSLDGTESHTTFMNRPRVTTAKVSADAQHFETQSVTTPPWGPPGTKMTCLLYTSPSPRD